MKRTKRREVRRLRRGPKAQSRSKVQSVYVTVRHLGIAKRDEHPLQKTVTIPEHSYEEVWNRIGPVVERMQVEGQKRQRKQEEE